MPSYSKTQDNFYSLNINPQMSNLSKAIQGDSKLWQPSEISHNYVSPRISFSREQRFNLHSIYWPQNNQSMNQFTRLSKQRSEIDSLAKQISKKIDDEQKNQIRIKRKGSDSSGRVQIIFSESSRGRNASIKSEKKGFLLNQKNQEILKRLAVESPKKQSLLRDRHGHRSNLVHGEDEQLHKVVRDEMQIMGHSTGFKTSSRRLNLNLPHNYYPGPGTYQIKRYLQELDNLDKRRVLTARQPASE